MSTAEKYCSCKAKEVARLQAFESIWENDLHDVFADVAKYYDRANTYATLGMLDVCAGTNVIGIGLLKKQPTLDVYAVDRSMAMQKVGRKLAHENGFEITSSIGDVHHLPYPDNYFDVVTLQYATRHLRVINVFSEVWRVLKPGGHFYHCDMLRPESKLVEEMYYLYLKACLSLISWSFRSGPASIRCRDYFIEAIRMFYSARELSKVLAEMGFTGIIGSPVLAGTVAFHAARKS